MKKDFKANDLNSFQNAVEGYFPLTDIFNIAYRL